VLVVEKKLGY